ncbi:phage virion morphogenesis protein [Neisseria sp. 19428wB4_WF04]|nr:phage virion morphogenesis protein [Neisseria sp. 19428wB4_WF04]MBF0805012.1 phage virion morphogenesis protein [Neisseria sp. 19428wB4_WF04]
MKVGAGAANSGGKTLQLSGQLPPVSTLKSKTGFALINSNKKYAAIHHLGGQAGRSRAGPNSAPSTHFSISL